MKLNWVENWIDKYEYHLFKIQSEVVVSEVWVMRSWTWFLNQSLNSHKLWWIYQTGDDLKLFESHEFESLISLDSLWINLDWPQLRFIDTVHSVSFPSIFDFGMIGFFFKTLSSSVELDQEVLSSIYPTTIIQSELSFFNLQSKNKFYSTLINFKSLSSSLLSYLSGKFFKKKVSLSSLSIFKSPAPLFFSWVLVLGLV